MVELLAEGSQLAEELRQIVDYTQGGSLARLRINNTRRTGCDVDVCMVIMHMCGMMTILKQSSQICIFYLFSLEHTAFLCYLSSSFGLGGGAASSGTDAD